MASIYTLFYTRYPFFNLSGPQILYSTSVDNVKTGGGDSVDASDIFGCPFYASSSPQI